MRSVAAEQRLAAHLGEILDEYLDPSDLDWRKDDLTQHTLTQSTCLLSAAMTLREMGLWNVGRDR